MIGDPAGCLPRNALGRRLPALVLCLVLGACAVVHPKPWTNRPDGEGYAGTGALVLRIGLAGPPAPWYSNPFAPRPERAATELHYLGIDEAGRALFQRSDADAVAGPGRAGAPEPVTGDPSGRPDVRRIAIDLRTTRQIHIQGKIVEILEATASGVVFRLY